MTKIAITIDKEIDFKLKDIVNKSEFIRQAIREKLANDKTKSNSKEETNEFLKLMKEHNNLINSMQKKLVQHDEILEDIKTRVMKSDATLLRLFNIFVNVMPDTIYEIYKLNPLLLSLVDKNFLEQNRVDLLKLVDSKLNEFKEKHFS